MKRTAIYGGSFDPPHKGHAYIIRKLTEAFDRVIVVPSFISPFKTQANAAPPDHRIEMLRLSLLDEGMEQDKFPLISTFEVDKKGTSYTIDTVRNFHSADQKLYFVMGAEGLPMLNKWRNFDELKELVTFYIVPRAGFENAPLLTEFAAAYALLTPPDVSSALIKPALALSRAQNMLSPSVIKYIQANGLYADYKKITDGYAAWNMRKERIEHSYNAVKCGIRLAKIHGADVDKIVTALMLHDIGKYADDELLKQNNVIAPIPDMPSPCRHAFIGAHIAQQYFSINDSGVLDAIRYHTSCRPDMSKLEKIVALSDYLEEGRRFAGVEKLRILVQNDLDGALLAMLENTIKYLKSSSREIFTLSLDALEYYKKVLTHSVETAD